MSKKCKDDKKNKKHEANHGKWRRTQLHNAMYQCTQYLYHLIILVQIKTNLKKWNSADSFSNVRTNALMQLKPLLS